MTTPAVLTFAEACKFLRISGPTLRKIVTDGKIKGRRVGHHWRFLRTELEAYLRGQDVSPAA